MSTTLTIRMKAVPRGERVRCPYCHDGLGEEPRWTCSACQAPHHVECHGILDACASCRGKTALAAPADEEPVHDDAWHGRQLACTLLMVSNPLMGFARDLARDPSWLLILFLLTLPPLAIWSVVRCVRGIDGPNRSMSLQGLAVVAVWTVLWILLFVLA